MWVGQLFLSTNLYDFKVCWEQYIYGGVVWDGQAFAGCASFVFPVHRRWLGYSKITVVLSCIGTFRSAL